jgi:AP endonuclease 1
VTDALKVVDATSSFNRNRLSDQPPTIEPSKMPRRLGRKSENEKDEADAFDTAEKLPTTPKKGRKAAKVEAVEVITKENISPARSTRKKIKKEVELDEEVDDTEEPPLVPKINRVKAKTVVKEEETQKPKKAPAKRKVKTEEDEDEDADDTKVKKKRKTKEEKEAEAMPLAARTVISTLKKAMHIGAHVSAAGGMHVRIFHAACTDFWPSPRST